jgi:RND family efflux transporter MFP subunit
MIARWTLSKATIWLATIALAGVPGCGQRKPTGGVAVESPRVTVAKPQRKTIRYTITQPGQVEAFDQARLYAKIPAYVEKYLVDIGDRVKGPQFDSSGKMIQRGQLLAELSAPELDQELQQKRALVIQANADVEQAQAAIKVAQANAASAKAQVNESTAAIDRVEADYVRWNSEYTRVVQLVSRSAVTQKLADETKAQMMAADAARNEARARVDSARSAENASLAQVEKSIADETAIRARRLVAEAEQARTAALVDYLKIEAPFDGTISERNADIGYFAQAGGGNQAQPLFVLVRTDPVRVFVDVPEMDASLVEVGDGALVRVQSLAGHDFPGKVTRTSWALEPTTRTLRTEVDVANAEGELRPGMYARVTIALAEKPDACVVPASAVISQENRAWCFVVEDDKAVRKTITLGIKSNAEVEIASGLSGDEWVIQDKGASLINGQKVDVVAAPAVN